MQKSYVLYPLLFFIISIFGCATTQVMPHNIQKAAFNAGYRVVGWDSTALFFEDFSKYSIGSMVPFGPWKSLNSDAHIVSAVQPAGLIGNILEINRGVVTIDTSFKNFTLELNVKDGEPQILFLLKNDGSAGYYITKPLGYMSTVKLFKFAGSTKTMIGKSSGIDLPSDKWQYWKIKVDREKIKIYLNNIKIIEVKNNDPSLSCGRIGLGSNYGTVHYDNIKVTSLHAEEK